MVQKGLKLAFLDKKMPVFWQKFFLVENHSAQNSLAELGVPIVYPPLDGKKSAK